MALTHKNPAAAADVVNVNSVTYGGIENERVSLNLDDEGVPQLWPGDETDGAKVQVSKMDTGSFDPAIRRLLEDILTELRLLRGVDP